MGLMSIKYTVIVCVLFFSIKGFAQTEVDSLIGEQQYLTAYQLLCERDQEHVDVEVVLQKVDVALNYYLDSDYHRAFSFVNLRKGEDLTVLRELTPHGLTPFKFEIDSVLLRLMDSYPDDYRLVMSLADYYNQIYYQFGDRWGERAEVLLEKSHYYYMQAYENGVFDAASLYALGYYQSLFQNYFQSQNWFQKSLQLNNDDPLTNYSLAVTYLFDGLPQKGIRYSERAYYLYVDSLKKADAARVTGILLSKTDDYQKALKYYIEANELSPNYRPNQMYLLQAYLKLDKDSLVVEMAFEVLSSALHGPEVPEEFIELFLQVNKEALLHQVFDKVLDDYPNDYEACGNVCFHYGKLLFKEGEVRKAKRQLKLSRKYFGMVFDSSHQVFDAINQMLIHM